MADHAPAEEARLLGAAIARLRAGILALVFGFATGTGLALATLWLVIRGGEAVGPNLALLANYFPGYTVTWHGSLLGFLYGWLLGAVFGWTMAWIYNRVASRQARRP